MIENVTRRAAPTNDNSLIIKNKGITLIALVITIIVLLILAGITIVVLTGENGLLKKAQDFKNNNAYYSAEEKVKLSYMALKTEIMSKGGNYDATSSEGTTELGEIVENDLDPNKEKDEWSVDYSVAGLIKILYKNPLIEAGCINGVKPAVSGQVEYKIILQNNDAVLRIDTEYKAEVANTLIANTTSHTTPYVAFSTDGPKYRVLYDVNSPYGIEIISDNSIGEPIYLGRGDQAGNNISDAGNLNTSERAIWSYTNMVDTLNKAAEERTDAPTNLVTQVRCVGTRPDNKDFKIKEKYYKSLTSHSNPTFPNNYDGLWEQGEGIYAENENPKWVKQNLNYTSDRTQMENLNIFATENEYFLASRKMHVKADGSTHFYTHYFSNDGTIHGYSLFYINTDGSISTGSVSRGIRPVLCLATNVEILDGDGTSDSPYILGTN